MGAFAYPVMLELRGRRAVVVGEEAVRHGKAETVLAAGARVSVVAEGPDTMLDRLEADPRVVVHRRGFHPSDLDGAFLCVAASRDPALRARIHREGRDRGVLMNVVDDAEHCDFAAPAVVRRGDLLLAIGTGGRSPALARRLREELAERYGAEWGDVLDVLDEVRQATLPALPDLEERAKRWREALDPEEIAGLIRDGRREEARFRLLDRLVGVRVR